MNKIKFLYTKKTNQQGFGHTELLSAIVIIVIIAIVGVRMLNASHALSTTSLSSNTCTRSAIDVPSCGVLWGAYTPNENTALPVLESQVGRKFDFFQSYHDFSTTNSGAIPNTADKALMAGGRTLLATWRSVNWSTKASYSWSQIASGSLDASVIDPQAAHIKAIAPTKIFLSFDHEMDGAAASGFGTPAQYVAAYRHIHDRFAADGVTNVVWVWTVTGWSAHYPTLASYYPGDAYVDWLGYDPYNFYTCNGNTTWSTPATLFNTYYKWVGAGNLGANAASKPMMMPEYGSHDDPANPTRNQQWYASIPAALQSMPRVKALSEFDSDGTFCSSRLTGTDSLTGNTIQSGTLAGFKQAGLSGMVLGTTTPSPDITSPIATITAPASKAVVKGTLTISGTASDNVGVVKVELIVDNKLITTDTSTPYAFAIDTTKYSDGTHSVYLEAFDAAGNHGVSTTISISVQNTTPSIYGKPGPITGIDNKCLDNAGNKKIAFNKIQLYGCNSTGAQVWTVNASGSIVNNNGYCLDVHGDSTTVGTVVDLYPCNSTPAQIWKINTATHTIINSHSGLCLDDRGAHTGNGNEIWMYTCNGTAAQVWQVI